MIDDLLLYLSVLCQFLLVILGAFISLHGEWSKKYNIHVIVLFVLIGTFGMFTSIKQSYVAKNENAKLYNKLSSVDNGVSELKRLTQAKPDDPPEKVLAAAAKKIMELDAKTKQLEGGVRDIISVRHLTDAQKDILFNDLAVFCSQMKNLNISLIWQNDSEAISYANDFYQVLTNTKCWHGYRSALGEQFRPAVLPKGVSIIVKDHDDLTKEAMLLMSAFKKAKIPYELVVSKSITEPVIILVGFKR
jgi:hypothetical protein